MARRLLAVALLPMLCIGAVLPVAGAWRCPYMGRRAADGCCQEQRALERDEHGGADVARLAARCCDPIAAPTLDARAGASRADEAVSSSPHHGAVFVLLPPPALLVDAGAPLRQRVAQPRGRPPGDQLHRLSSVLRV